MKGRLQRYPESLDTGTFLQKKFHSSFFTKCSLIAKVFHNFCGWFRVRNSFFYFDNFRLHAQLINSSISEGTVYAPFNLGQCLNVTLLDLVAVQVLIFKPLQIFKEDKCDWEKNINYCLLKFIISLTFQKLLESKRRQQNKDKII